MNSITPVGSKELIATRFVLRRHLNKLRWLTLAMVFSLLILLPFLHLYQTYLAINAYSLLSNNEKLIFNAMDSLTSPFTDTPQAALDNFKGTTWSGTLFGIQLSDPLAILTGLSASFSVDTSFLLSALIPILLTLVLGRFFCGWICPATFIYELNDNLGTWLHAGLRTLLGSRFDKTYLPIGRHRFNPRLKYFVLTISIIITIAAGTALISNIYPPAIIGREIYYLVVMGSFGIGSTFLLATLLFDLLIARRGFCRYLCPGGALYSLLSRFRVLRIQRDVTHCNDCAKCNTACQFDLDPMQDSFGQDCNNCSACVAICPTDALSFTTHIRDKQYQGSGHLGNNYKKQRQENSL